jgi:hypothetical protein
VQHAITDAVGPFNGLRHRAPLPVAQSLRARPNVAAKFHARAPRPLHAPTPEPKGRPPVAQGAASLRAQPWVSAYPALKPNGRPCAITSERFAGYCEWAPQLTALATCSPRPRSSQCNGGEHATASALPARLRPGRVRFSDDAKQVDNIQVSAHQQVCDRSPLHRVDRKHVRYDSMGECAGPRRSACFRLGRRRAYLPTIPLGDYRGLG